MNKCIFSIEFLDVSLHQTESKSALFTVNYGMQIDSNLGYSEACKKFGEAVFHALACDGVLNNEGVL